MRKVLWKKCSERDSLCDIRLTCHNEEVRNLITNYLNTVDLFNEQATGIGPPVWMIEEGEVLPMYVIPTEFEALERMIDVFGIELVEGV